MTTFDDDICYCLDDGCPDKGRCYRYAIRGRVYAVYTATLRDPETGHCAYFIQTTTTPARRAAASE